MEQEKISKKEIIVCVADILVFSLGAFFVLSPLSFVNNFDKDTQLGISMLFVIFYLANFVLFIPLIDYYFNKNSEGKN